MKETPMPKKLVIDLKPGEPIDDDFLLAQSELRSARNDSLYLSLELRDRSGTISGRMWDASQIVYETFKVDEFVHVKGRVEQYRDDVQISVKALSQPDLSSLRLRDFLPQSPKDPDEMEKELREVLDMVEDPDYRRLNAAFMEDEARMAAFRNAPAAVANHHAYLGGLLEHTLSMARIAATVADHYPEVRKDILLTGVLFHDIGKTVELRFNRNFRYSDSGQLIGHLTQGVLIVRDKARELEGFPDEKLTPLMHMILSHHGEREYGSPVLPMTPESFALHFIDNLDAKLRTVSDKIGEDLNTQSDFTAYIRSLERRLYKK